MVTEDTQAWANVTVYDPNRGEEVHFKVVTAYDTNLDVLNDLLSAHGFGISERGLTVVPRNSAVTNEYLDGLDIPYLVKELRQFYPLSKINAIKRVRELFVADKMSLLEAKNLVDKLWEDGTLARPSHNWSNLP
jgi:hypothetical protein